MGIKWKDLFPTFDKFKEVLNENDSYFIVGKSDITLSKYYRFINIKYNSRFFKWASAGAILNEIDQILNSGYFLFRQFDDFQNLSLDELISKTDETRVYDLPGEDEPITTSNQDKYLVNKVSHKTNDEKINYANKIERLRQLDGNVLKILSKMFLPVMITQDYSQQKWDHETVETPEWVSKK